MEGEKNILADYSSKLQRMSKPLVGNAELAYEEEEQRYLCEMGAPQGTRNQ